MIQEQEEKRFSYGKFVIVLGLFFVINLFVSHRIFVTNIELTKTNSEIEKLSESNKELEITVSKAESVDTIMKRAKLLGFDGAPRIIYLEAAPLAQK